MVYPKLYIRNNQRITDKTLREMAFILFFCNPFVRLLLSFILGQFGLSEYARILTIAIVYMPVFLLMIVNKKYVIKDFILLWVILILFFCATLAIHPNYEYWYTRSTYGVWDYVLRPDNGLYAYLFIRLLEKPDDIIKSMKKCAWIMYPYYMYLLYDAISKGYWLEHNAAGKLVPFSYSLTYGYDLLLYVLIFLYALFEEKKVIDLVFTVIGVFMIVRGGSRGPLLCIGIFMIIYIIKSFQEARSNQKIGIMMVILTATVLLTTSYKYIFAAIINILSKLNVSSRTLIMLLEGSIADDTGREEIWTAAIKMITENPLGYGAMGTRHVIQQYHVVGHCHQVFLEILVDFGVVAGTFIILFLVVNACRILFTLQNSEWFGVFLILFARSCHLILSGTYWHLASFWACIGVGVNIYIANKKKNT